MRIADYIENVFSGEKRPTTNRTKNIFKNKVFIVFKNNKIFIVFNIFSKTFFFFQNIYYLLNKLNNLANYGPSFMAPILEFFCMK